MCPATCGHHPSASANPCFPHCLCGHLSLVLRWPPWPAKHPSGSAHLRLLHRSTHPLLPPPFQYAAFAAVHTLAQPGIKATKGLMLARWVQMCMSTEITHWSRDCQFCQWAKVTRQPRSLSIRCPSQPGGSPTSTWTWWALYRGPRRVTTTSSQWWTALPTGWRISCWRAPAPSPSPTPSLAVGWPALASPTTSPRTTALSSFQHCGLSFLST